MSNAELSDPLQQIPDSAAAGEQAIFNAENITITAEGRIFATGSRALYKIVQSAPGPCQLTEIDFAVQGSRANYF